MARWMLQLKELRELCDAVSLMCNISAEDHSKYVQRRVSKITNKQLCVSLIKHSHSFGVALNGIEEGAKYHNDLFCVPSICTIAQPNFSQQKTSWQKHILSDRQKMLELKETVDGTISSIDKESRHSRLRIGRNTAVTRITLIRRRRRRRATMRNPKVTRTTRTTRTTRATRATRTTKVQWIRRTGVERGTGRRREKMYHTEGAGTAKGLNRVREGSVLKKTTWLTMVCEGGGK